MAVTAIAEEIIKGLIPIVLNIVKYNRGKNMEILLQDFFFPSQK